MAAVEITGIDKEDLVWQIEYDESKCALCGKCAAVCTFNAIKADVRKLRKIESKGLLPNPETEQKAIPVIKQVVTKK